MSKLMVVLDSVKLNYLNKQGQLDLINTKYGQKLSNVITAPRAGLGASWDETTVHFSFPQIQELTPAGKPKPVTGKQIKQFQPDLFDSIVEEKPEVIVTMGNTALWGVTGNKGISTKRGIPQELTFTHSMPLDEKGKPINDTPAETHKVWVLPTYSLEALWVDPSHEAQFKVDIALARSYLKNGSEVFQFEKSIYDYVDDWDKVKDIFENILPNQKLIAVDSETNTLYPEFDGSKMLVLSLSWKEKQGVVIPIDHKETPWNPTQIQELKQMIVNLMESKQWKVLHNGKFDIRFMMHALGLKNAINCIDSMMMHYVAVSEELNVGRGLKQLAYEYTDMGGYDEPLDSYKETYLREAKEKWIANKEAEKQSTGAKYKKSDYTDPKNEIDGSNFNYEWIPLDILAPYAAADTDVCLRISHELLKLVEENPKWIHLIFDYYPRLQNYLARCEENGVQLDPKQIAINKEGYGKEVARLLALIKQDPAVQQLEEARMIEYQYYLVEKQKKPAEREDKDRYTEAHKLITVSSDGIPKYEFNPSSNADLKEVFYVLMGYEVPHHLPDDRDFVTESASKQGLNDDTLPYKYWKTDSKIALPYLKETYGSTLADLLMQYAKVNKLLRDFVEKFPRIQDAKGRIHTKFNMAGTVTSRLSSSGLVNMQQVPRRLSDANSYQYQYPIKAMITSRFKGGVMINCDYATLEIYVAALVSRDQSMLQTLLDGKDYHSQTAREAFGIPDDEEVPKDIRSKSKAVSFGLIYGESASGLAAKEDMTQQDAQNTIDRVLDSKPQLKEAIERSHQQAKQVHYVETLGGNYRRLDVVKSNDKSKVSRALRQAFNAIVQGSGAYCTNNALIMLGDELQKHNLKAEMVLTVHDSIVVDCPPEEVSEVCDLMKYCFENLQVPEILDLDVGNLRVPEKYLLGNGKFRLPLKGACEFGLNYNDDVEYDKEDLATFKSVTGFCKYQYTLIQLKEYLQAGILTEDQYNGKLQQMEAVKPQFQAIGG